MKHLKNIALASVLCAGTCLNAEGQTVPPAIPSDPEIEANIQNWLKKMTIEEMRQKLEELTGEEIEVTA